jgi:hypothetical protein
MQSTTLHGDFARRRGDINAIQPNPNTDGISRRIRFYELK